jgi:hypothetical protein
MKRSEMLESPASCFAFRYGASLNMTAANYRVVSTERLPRSRDKFALIHIPVAVPLVAAGAQDYFAVGNFSARDTILVGILHHVTSQRFSDSG